jgi:hypothetical protein
MHDATAHPSHIDAAALKPSRIIKPSRIKASACSCILKHGAAVERARRFVHKETSEIRSHWRKVGAMQLEHARRRAGRVLLLRAGCGSAGVQSEL